MELDGPPSATPTTSPTASSTASPWELRVLDGPDVGLRVPLPFGRSLLGRADGATVVLTDPRASRRHAELDVRRGSEITVRDVGGTNGTSVGGARVDASPRSLSEGDVVEIGSTRLQVRAESSRRERPSARRGWTSPRAQRGRREPGRAGARAVSRRSWSAPSDALSLGSAHRSADPGWCARRGDAFADHVAVRTDRTGAVVRDVDRGATASVRGGVGRRAQAALTQASATLDQALLRERERLERSHPPLAEVLAVAETRSAPLWRGRRRGGSPGCRKRGRRRWCSTGSLLPRRRGYRTSPSPWTWPRSGLSAYAANAGSRCPRSLPWWCDSRPRSRRAGSSSSWSWPSRPASVTGASPVGCRRPGRWRWPAMRVRTSTGCWPRSLGVRMPTGSALRRSAHSSSSWSTDGRSRGPPSRWTPSCAAGRRSVSWPWFSRHLGRTSRAVVRC